MTDLRAFIADLARHGGALAREHAVAVTNSTVTTKAARDYVSYVDGLVERALVDRIRAAFPDHRVLGEESGASGGTATNGPLWIIDPIDGTTNFIRGIPLFAVSIGFCDEHGEHTGAIYDPSRDELFLAQRGGGLTVNDRPAKTSGCTELNAALIATALPFRFPQCYADAEPVFLGVQRACDDLRRSGSACLDLAWVAAGRLDAYFELGIYPWDIAAGQCLVRCAGGVTTDYRGLVLHPTRQRSIVAAATPALHAALVERVQPVAKWVELPPFAV